MKDIMGLSGNVVILSDTEKQRIREQAQELHSVPAVPYEPPIAGAELHPSVPNGEDSGQLIYPPRRDGEWVKPRKRQHMIACCDCGLVHAFDFKVIDGAVFYRARRDEDETSRHRATSQPDGDTPRRMSNEKKADVEG